MGESIGPSLVAAGASLPERVASVLSTIRGCEDIAFENVVGWNIFNTPLILGFSALVTPLPVHSFISGFGKWWMRASPPCS